MTDPQFENSNRQQRVRRVIKIALLTIGILLLLALALRVAGVGGEHGPSRHAMALSTARV